MKRGRRLRNFFVLKTTVSAAHRTLQRSGLDVSQLGKPHLGTRSSDHPSSSQDGIILALQRNTFGVREAEKSCLRIVPFPHGPVSFVNLALDPTAYPEHMSDCFNFLIPRATFDQLARAYGGMHFPPPLVSGGLAPWQLRFARDTINANLEEELSLERIARECRLSVSHFARAFTRSTGVSPHRWLMQRRVDIAKDLMLSTDSSLVEISLRCGFSDQSHFTRVFAEATGETPGRWRQIQLN